LRREEWRIGEGAVETSVYGGADFRSALDMSPRLANGYETSELAQNRAATIENPPRSMD
jgi:hypothetical protein